MSNSTDIRFGRTFQENIAVILFEGKEDVRTFSSLIQALSGTPLQNFPARSIRWGRRQNITITASICLPGGNGWEFDLTDSKLPVRETQIALYTLRTPARQAKQNG